MGRYIQEIGDFRFAIRDAFLLLKRVGSEYEPLPTAKELDGVISSLEQHQPFDVVASIVQDDDWANHRDFYRKTFGDILDLEAGVGVVALNNMRVDYWNRMCEKLKKKKIPKQKQAAYIEKVEKIRGYIQELVRGMRTDLADLFGDNGSDQALLQPTAAPEAQKGLGSLLPEKLRTDAAANVFQKAIDAKLITYSPEGLKWNDTKQLLAYFAEKLSAKFSLTSKLDKDGKTTTAWKPFETLFRETGLRNAKQNWMRLNTKFEPTGFEKVDAIL